MRHLVEFWKFLCRISPFDLRSTSDEIVEAHRVIAFTIAITILLLVLSMTRGFTAGVGLSGLVFLSGVATGIFFGFLFSIPRIYAGPPSNQAIASRSATTDNQPGSGARYLESNSNLERISDWLTTMMVGVALINIGELGNFFESFNRYLMLNAKVFTVHGVRTALHLPAVCSFLLIIGTVLGFLTMYLTTRIRLAELLNKTEQKLSNPLDKVQVEAVLDKATGLPRTPVLEAALKTKVLYPEEAVEIMNRLLYEPEGYIDAINIGSSLLSTEVSTLPSFWFYLAAAYGQKFTAMKSRGASGGELKKVRDQTIDVARRAVAIDKRYREELRRISNSDGPDDDLKDLREDDDFIKLLNEER